MSAEHKPASGLRIGILLVTIGAVAGFGAGVEYGSRSSSVQFGRSPRTAPAAFAGPQERVFDRQVQEVPEVVANAQAVPVQAEPAEEPAAVESQPELSASTSSPQPGLINEESDPEPERCTALTRTGTRCKRAAQSGRTRCWQQ